MRKSSGFVFAGAVEIASEVTEGGNFSRLLTKAEASEGDGSWDLRGVEEVIPESEPYAPLARTDRVKFFRLDPDAYDLGEHRDGDSTSRVVLVEAKFPKFEGYVREVSLFVRGGGRFGTGVVAAIQRFPRVWASEDFTFCARFALDMRG